MKPLDLTQLPLEGRRLIEAGAGTGKTFTIAGLHLRALVEPSPLKQRPLDITEVLVVTFTEAATAELRERIHARVKAAALAFDAESTDLEDPLLSALVQQTPDPQATAARLRNCLSRIDQAPIFTIHGYCHRVLRDLALDSGQPLKHELITDSRPMRERGIEDFWRRHFHAKPVSYIGWARQHWNHPHQLLDELEGVLNNPTLDIGPAPEPAIINALTAEVERLLITLKDAWPTARPQLTELIGNAVAAGYLKKSANKREYHPDELEQDWRTWDLWFASPTLPTPHRLELVSTVHMASCRSAKAKKAGWNPPHLDFMESCSALFDAVESLDRIWAWQLRHAAVQSLHTSIRAHNRAAATFGFEDLLLGVDAGLQGPAGDQLARTLANRHPIALVDEFQDTDPLQYRIFDRVYAEPNTALLLIGDPKQAIYAFRGADVFTYLQARQATRESVDRFTLHTNWRASDELVTAVDQLFRQHPAPFVYDEDIRLPKVEAAVEPGAHALKVNGETAAALQVLPLKPEGKPLSKEKAQAMLAERCAVEVSRLLNLAVEGQAWLQSSHKAKAPLRASDIAVLVSSHDEAHSMQQALAGLGVPSAHRGQQSVFSTPQALELEAVLRAVEAPESESRMRACVATQLLGLDAAGVYAELASGPQWEHRIERFMAYRDLWESRGPLVMLHQLLRVEAVVARIFAPGPQSQGAPRRATNLLHLAELLQQAADEHPGMERQLRWLRQQIEHPPRGDGASELRLEGDQTMVQIVTVHASKGLEFPVVVLPFVALTKGPHKVNGKGGVPPVLFHDPTAADQLQVDFGTEAYTAREKLAAKEQFAERVRLLYVALTRASHGCILGWGSIRDIQHTPLAYLLSGKRADDFPPTSLDTMETEESLIAPWTRWRDEHRVDLEIRPFAPPITAPAGMIGSEPAVLRGQATPPPPIPPTRANWRLSSYSALVADMGGGLLERPEHDDLIGPMTKPPTAPQYRSFFDFPAGAQAGNCLHHLLEHIEFGGARMDVQWVERTLEQFGFDPAWTDVLCDQLDTVLQTPLNDTGVRLSSIGRHQCVREMEFYLPVHGFEPSRIDAWIDAIDDDDRPSTHRPRLKRGLERGTLKGYIDLVFEHQGRYYLADYKSNHLGDRFEDYRPECLRASVLAHRYDLQYLLYTLALHRHLQARLSGYTYEQHFGGVFYLYLRGMQPDSNHTGVYFARPSAEWLQNFDAHLLGDPA